MAAVTLAISEDNPGEPDVRALLRRHLDFAHSNSPADHVHALAVEGLLDPRVTFYSARRDGQMVGVGALRRLDATHVEIKSMHVAAEARRGGVGSAILEHLLATARAGGYRRVSLETGAMDAFAAARRLYEAAGFSRCPPFADYTDNPFSVCMTMELPEDGSAAMPRPRMSSAG